MWREPRLYDRVDSYVLLRIPANVGLRRPTPAVSEPEPMSNPDNEYKPIRVPVYVKPGAIDVIAFVVLVVFTIVGVARAVSATTDLTTIGFAEIMEFCLWFGVGLSVSGLLASCAVLVRLGTDVREGFARLERFQYETRSEAPRAVDASSAGAAGPSADTETTAGTGGAAQWQEMLILLRDLRDNALLSEEERREKKERVAADEILQTRSTVRSLLAADDFTQARDLADALARKYPREDAASALVDEIENSREKRAASAIRDCVKQVADLISISAWDRARELAEQLRQRHPDAEAAAQLLDQIERDHLVFQAEQRQRMYAEVQRFTTRKRWNEALAAARTFMERFPNCQETELLQLELPTLETNAEIARRQELESEIMELAKHGRYIEAAELARRVIERYPDSPQAEVLRTQLGRLEQLANDPDAPPARIRME